MPETADHNGRYTQKMVALFDQHRARFAVAVASLRQRMSHAVEPADRYFYDDHAPALAPLSAGFARARDRLLDGLVNRSVSVEAHRAS